MSAKMVTVDSEHAGQRIDNFLMVRLKGLPKSRIYRALRKGEVRVNKGRVKPEYKIQVDDQIRIPPLRVAPAKVPMQPSLSMKDWLEQHIIYEDKRMIIINKPAGLPVHGGTAQSIGLIETLREMRPKNNFLELVHRLDKQTSGCLLIAKKRAVLLELHRLLTNREVRKQYLLLVKGRWQGDQRQVNAPLQKNCMQSGERMVLVSAEGKSSLTVFQPLKVFATTTLLLATPITGRTHQIRVHSAHIGHPIAGDEKYGDKEFNHLLKRFGLKRLFLHSASISCTLVEPPQQIDICALIPADLIAVIESISAEDHQKVKGIS